MLVSNVFTFLKILILLIRYNILPHLIYLSSLRLFFGKKHKYVTAEMQSLFDSVTSLLESLGPTFIKLSQVLSTRRDLIGEIAADSLSRLQDSVKPFPHKKALAIIEEEIEDAPEKIFSKIDQNTVSSASVAQVYHGTLTGGEEVAIKILRPNIVKKFVKDIKLLRFIAILAYPFLGQEYYNRAKYILSELEGITETELDMRVEAAATEAIAEDQDNHGKAHIKVPKVYWKYVTQNMLVISWMEGEPLNQYINGERTLQKYEALKVVKSIALSFFYQAFGNGIFHADLHPGNILLNTSKDVILLDYGIIGYLSEDDRLHIAEIMYCFIRKKYERLADIHIEQGYLELPEDKEKFMLACRSIREMSIGKDSETIQVSRLLKNIIRIFGRFKIKTKPHLFLLHKTIATLEGISKQIYPDKSIWKLIEKEIIAWNSSSFNKISMMKRKKKEIIKLLTSISKFLQQGGM